MAEQHSGGLWVVINGERQWSEWQRWLRAERGYRTFPHRMTVVGEWPPETDEGKRIVHAKIEAACEQARVNPMRRTAQPFVARSLKESA